MKKNLYSLFGSVSILVFFLSGSLATVQAGIDFNINFGPPSIIIAEPPEIIMIPQTGIYYVTDRKYDIFFYNGFWWSPRGGRWYRSAQFNGKWDAMHRKDVPRHLIIIPRDYRNLYKKEVHINYGQWKKKHQNNGYNGQNDVSQGNDNKKSGH